jgi:hypothetical protein
MIFMKAMSERASKTLLLIESVMFLVPVSMLTLFYASFLVSMYRDAGLAKEPWLAHVAPAFTFLGVALQLCGWRLIAAFLIDGRPGIRRVARFYIGAASFGAALVAVSGLVVLLLMVFELELPDSLGLLSVNYVALPALIPFVHVMLERWRSRTADVPAANPDSVEPRAS